MVNLKSIQQYRGASLLRGATYLYVRPHPALTPYLSAYTVTFPTPSNMTDAYTIMPTASTTLVYSFADGTIRGNLRGVNTAPANVGKAANCMDMLILIEFRPGGLFPFLGIRQQELLNEAFSFYDLDKNLHLEIETALLSSQDITGLVQRLDEVFLNRLPFVHHHPQLAAAMNAVVTAKGFLRTKTITDEVHYSEKQLNRLFKEYVGIGTKHFARIVRLNHALALLEQQPWSLTHIAAQAGYFDQSHFNKEFQQICGITPAQYRKKMSIFYKDDFKL